MIQRLYVIKKYSHMTKKQKLFQQILMKIKQSVKCKILYFTFICINYCGMAVSIYCYLIKYQAKQKYLLPFHITNNEFKEFMY